MMSEATINVESSGAYRNGTQRNINTLEKFEKSFSRINTPSWMRDKVSQNRLRGTETDDINNQHVVPSYSDSKPPTTSEVEYNNDDESYN